jgi:hypothetical protein
MKLKPKKKKPPKFAANKRAFDSTMQSYRTANVVVLSAMQYTDGDGPTSRYEAKPTPTDFRCDVDCVITKCVKHVKRLVRFTMTYIYYDSIDPIDMEIYADKMMGPTRHGLEQGMGAEFIKRNLYPSSKYFKAVRQRRAR